MNLRDLEYVEAVGALQSFSKAAVACNVSQPALSNQVKKLEQELGAELFDRRMQEIRPTQLGQRVIASAKVLLAEAQKIRDMATEFRDPAALPLRIGMVPTLTPYLVFYLCDQIQSVLPDLKLEVSEASSAELIKLVANRDVDIALIPKTFHDGQMDFSPLFREPLFLATRGNHYLSKQKSVSLNEIPHGRLICTRTPLGFDAEAELQHFNLGADVEIRLDVTAAGLETVCRHISVSDDCAIVPALMLDRFSGERWDLSFVPIAGTGCIREIGVISRIGCPRKPLLSAIRERIASSPLPRVQVCPI